VDKCGLFVGRKNKRETALPGVPEVDATWTVVVNTS
jgi:hypothetical protein